MNRLLDIFYDEMKALVVQDTCNLACQGSFESEHLIWEKYLWSTCVEDQYSFECNIGQNYRRAEEKLRAEAGYYELDATA